MTGTLAVDGPGGSHRISAGSGQVNWVSYLLLFQFVYLISYVDRQLLTLVVGPVKESLSLNDLQVGFLQGFGFSLVLALAALVTARLVDTGNRARTLGACVTIWCLATICCGLAQNFWQLFAARTGLAVAEAAVPVAVLSMLSDLVPRTKIPRAGALFMISPFVGSGITLLAGGPMLAWLARFEGMTVPVMGTFEPWRALFLMIGAPGVFLGLGIFLMLREPARQPGHHAVAGNVSVWPFLRKNGAFLFCLMTFLAALNAANQTIYAWVPTMMIRIHAMSVESVGLTVGPVFILSGIAGSVLGTWWMGRGSEGALLGHVARTMMRTMMIFTVPMLLAPLMPNPALVLIMFAITLAFLAVATTSTLTPCQLCAPSELRGRVTAICSLYGSAVGGLGPFAVGAASDLVFRDPAKIHYALLLCFAVALAIGWLTAPLAVRMARRFDSESNR